MKFFSVIVFFLFSTQVAQAETNNVSIDMNIIGNPLGTPEIGKKIFTLDASPAETFSLKIDVSNYTTVPMTVNFELFKQKANEKPMSVMTWSQNIPRVNPGPRDIYPVDYTPADSAVTAANRFDRGTYTYFVKITSAQPTGAGISVSPETVFIDNADSASFVIRVKRNVVPEMNLFSVILVVFGALFLLKTSNKN